MLSDNSPTANRSAFFWPIIVAVALILIVATWLVFKLSSGILTYPDELFTAERSREMLFLGRGSVHFNFHHTFAKPPLQYWLTSFTLPLIRNSSTAVRIWPLVYGLLTAASVGWLAFLSDRTRPWLVPFAVAIFVSCPLFSTEAIRGLLDSGLVFFTTLALCFAQLARRDPRWWLAFAVACWLGALQKIPLIFLVWVVLIVVRSCNRDDRDRLPIPGLILSGLLAVALVSLWPLLQFWKFGMPLTKAFAGDDLDTLFGQGHLGARPYFEVLDGLVASGWAVGIFALLAAVGFLFNRREAPSEIIEMSILPLIVIFLAIVFNFRSVRYVLPVIPCLAICLAWSIHHFWEGAGRFRRDAVATILLVVISGFVQAGIKMHHQPRDASGEQTMAKKVGELQRDEAPIVLIIPPDDRQALRSTGFYLFHGNLRFPIKRLTTNEFQRSAPPGPLLGVCSSRELPAVQSAAPGLKIQLATAGLICWSSGE